MKRLIHLSVRRSDEYSDQIRIRKCVESTTLQRPKQHHCHRRRSGGRDRANQELAVRAIRFWAPVLCITEQDLLHLYDRN
jgi:hypothetical protein